MLQTDVFSQRAARKNCLHISGQVLSDLSMWALEQHTPAGHPVIQLSAHNSSLEAVFAPTGPKLIILKAALLFVAQWGSPEFLMTVYQSKFLGPSSSSL